MEICDVIVRMAVESPCSIKFIFNTLRQSPHADWGMKKAINSLMGRIAILDKDVALEYIAFSKTQVNYPEHCYNAILTQLVRIAFKYTETMKLILPILRHDERRYFLFAGMDAEVEAEYLANIQQSKSFT